MQGRVCLADGEKADCQEEHQGSLDDVAHRKQAAGGAPQNGETQNDRRHRHQGQHQGKEQELGWDQTGANGCKDLWQHERAKAERHERQEDQVPRPEEGELEPFGTGVGGIGFRLGCHEIPLIYSPQRTQRTQRRAFLHRRDAEIAEFFVGAEQKRGA